MEIKFEAVTVWLKDEELSRFCKAYGVAVPGFRTPDKAPRHLQLAALQRDVGSHSFYRYHLAQGWKQRCPELWNECETYVREQLTPDPDLDPVPWWVELGRRHSTTDAFLTVYFAGQLIVGAQERFFAPTVWDRVRAAWQPQNEAERGAYMAQMEARAAAEAQVAAAQMPVPEPAAPEPVAPERVDSDRGLAAQVKTLRQSVKRLTGQRKLLGKELAEAEALTAAAGQELARLWAQVEQYRRPAGWRHPAERTRRLVTALCAAWEEIERLQAATVAERDAAAASA